MGTFLAALPSPQPIFAAANDPELSSILAALLAMNNDDDFGELPPADDEFFAADSTALPVPAFFVHQYYQPAAMPFPPVPMPPPPPLAPVHAADHEGTSAGALQPAKRKRGRQMTASSASGSGGENTGQEGASTRASRRTVWVRERSTEWWDHLDGPSCPDADFRGAFRMSRATFGLLCDALGGAVAKEDTALRAAIPVRQRVAVCLRRLATAEPLSEVSRRFGLGISTCHSIVLQVCHALATVLMPAVIQWPDAATAAALAARFEAASGLPGVVGAVYTTHVPIVAPKANVVAYYDSRLTERSQKASYSVAVQAVSDADGAFTHVYIGLPGSLSDAAVLGRSALCARRGELGLLGGHGQEQRLVGGASYPLTDWMLVPYAHPNMTGTQNLFNDRIGAARDVARGAVRRLKARWRCLQRRTEAKIQDLTSLIAACCVLHNVCERAGEVLDPDLMQYELDDDEADVAHDAAPPAAAVLARDRIAHGLLHGSHAGE
ncbi:hypothetical protein BAE44_0012051 [Dichanthelium oligosanthes]|uniref:DDE Tnp4 domain-containing protein n=1 Tax=Dichanthelium oligosanthes TaxID=888268 RepID=A0A1E5VP94_9POAL|nr:hypothetical protein BAE44_0012051 [Dichanthelium oligosanthes]